MVYQAYNLSAMGNATDIVSLTKVVNDNLMFGQLGNMIVLSLFIIFFMSFYSSSYSGAKASLAAAFISLLIAMLLRILGIVSQGIVYGLMIYLAMSFIWAMWKDSSG